MCACVCVCVCVCEDMSAMHTSDHINLECVSMCVNVQVHTCMYIYVLCNLQSPDCVAHSWNPEIACAILGFCNTCVQSRDCVNHMCAVLRSACDCTPDSE